MKMYGYPTVPLACLIDWVADWVTRDMTEPWQGYPLRFPRWRNSDPDFSAESPLLEHELPDAEALVRDAGWNQTAADWRAFLALGTVHAMRDQTGRVIATAATLPYGGRFAWISMVLVAREYQRRGLGDTADAPLHR